MRDPQVRVRGLESCGDTLVDTTFLSIKEVTKNGGRIVSAKPEFAASEVEWRRDLSLIAERILEGRVIFFLGAGVHRAPSLQQSKLPTGRELAATLASQYRIAGDPPCSATSHLRDAERCELHCWPQRPMALTRVAQIASTGERGATEFRQDLADRFRELAPPTRLHALLAAIAANPAQKKRARFGSNFPLFITTNYDDVLEQRLNRPDVVLYSRYKEESPDWTRGGFYLVSENTAEPCLRQKSAAKERRFCEERPLVLKIHGSVLREPSLQKIEDFVISEDDYIDFLVNEDVRLPVSLETLIKEQHILFLGYSLEDWNLRVFLRRLNRLQAGTSEPMSWWLKMRTDPSERRSWVRAANVNILEGDFERFITSLAAELGVVSDAAVA